MLDRFPPEIIEQILGHLPTASAIVNVARTNHKLYDTVSANEYGVFRGFIQNAFPSINTPPLWREMACTLTSRSRAWTRRSFIARECFPTESESTHTRVTAHQKFGYIPVIDSYEHWQDGSSSKRKQVLAFGAGGRLRLRITEKGQTEWKSLRLPDDHLQQNDIVDVRLLRPHQHHNKHGETLILRRANREIIQVQSGVGKDNITETSRYHVEGAHVDCLDVGTNSEPLVAICNTKSLQLFPTETASSVNRPLSTLSFAQNFRNMHRKRCLKFLDDQTIATGVQFVEGRESAPILTYKIAAGSVIASQLQPSSTTDAEETPRGRHCANVIACLDATASLASRPGQVFLSGWTDGVTRLYDLRAPSQVVNRYVDRVDDGQVLSLSVIGHERFFAGSHQNACLKVFDIRMPGGRVYSYLDTLPNCKKERSEIVQNQKNIPRSYRDINIFLALTVQRNRLWAPLPRQNNNTHLPRYRGSIYSLSTPSASSTTLFAGIENHVIQLDFVNTDDVLRKSRGSCDPVAGFSTLTQKSEVKDVLSLSCYERPRENHVATDPVLLRKQVDWHEVVRGIDDTQYGPPEDGWDHRWRVTRSWRTQRQGPTRR